MGGGHQVTVPLNPSPSAAQRNFSFGVFGAWYFLCFLDQVTVLRGGGFAKGGGLQEGRGVPHHIMGGKCLFLSLYRFIMGCLQSQGWAEPTVSPLGRACRPLG